MKKPVRPSAKLDTLAAKTALLRQLVEISSGSHNPQGVREVQNHVGLELKRLGFDLEWIPHPEDPHGKAPFLVARSMPATAGGKAIDLITHADTVFEVESGFLNFTVSKDGKTACGPGVIDDKGGIVVALAAIEKFMRESVIDIPIRMFVAPSEELGSPGFQKLLARLSFESAMAIGLEPAFEDGSIITTRRGNRWIELEVAGREAHSGRNPEQGINAAHALAYLVTEIAKLQTLTPGVTVSAGELSAGPEAGGAKFNIVPSRAAAKLDLRFPDFKGRELLQAKIDTLLKTPIPIPLTGQGVPLVKTTIHDDCPPLEPNPHLLPWIKRLQSHVQALEGRSINARGSGGAADLNYMSRPGFLAIDGLGPWGSGMHTLQETIVLSSLETRAEALAKFLSDLAQSELFEGFSQATN